MSCTKKLNDIERYLRAWSGQIKQASEAGNVVGVDGTEIDAKTVRPLMDKIYTEVTQIIDTER